MHIVINSLRIYEVPLLPYMDRPADTREGCKHRCTNAAMEYFKSEVMEMCHREGLYQIDLLNGSKERITEREYWAAKKGQLALDVYKRQDRYLYDYTFSNDNRQNPLMDKAHAYVENWKEAYKSNIGLLLFGDVGTGKSFFAGCIANALLDQDVPVLMTNFPTILNRLTGMFSEDRSEFIASFDEYDLLIIDDLGVAVSYTHLDVYKRQT